jgi:endonuclease G
MKLIFSTLFVFSFYLLQAQDTVRLKHTNYTTVFSKSKKYPVLVEWWVTRSKVGCTNPLSRKDNFKPDPLLSKETDIAVHYKGSGFDRGHMMPAADNLCQTQEVQDESFYFSNMAAQYHSLNAGDWKSVEVFTRELAQKHDSIYVWAGNIGEVKKIGEVSVPKECWKVIYVKETKELFAFMFENVQSKQTGIYSHKVDLDIVEQITGFKFQKL